ncbi:hypothetical protein PG996_008907 [Apiospora saccharicola]|uniref:DUF7918 domain-containing protein n=1 Tax=Apiospora saccharicola TaxID=335842 RepID=A0ABR1UZC6_9PEZI
MAVIEGIKGLQAWVEVNGQRVQEYNKPDDDSDSKVTDNLVAVANLTNPMLLDAGPLKDIPYVVKYIESIPGQKFGATIKITRELVKDCDHMGIKFTVDKNKFATLHEPSTNHRYRNRDWSHTTSYVVSGSNAEGFTQHFFKFSDVTVEDTNLPMEKLEQARRDAKYYGLIRVVCYRMSASTVPEPSLYYWDKPPTLDREVPEKAFKGTTVSSRSTYESKPHPSFVAMTQEDVFSDPLKLPCAIFEFRYRSKEALYQEGVLERPDAVDEMSPEELRRLARNWLNHEKQGDVKQDGDRKIKRENHDNAFNRKRSASHTIEPEQKRYKETVRDDGKVEIDLE